MLRVTNLIGFGGAGKLDSTPPVITSSSTFQQDGNVVMAKSITTDEPSTITIGGVDAAEVELAAPGALATTHTLRWSSNGTRDADAPSDDDADGVYEITITATDINGNASSPVSTTIDVDANWVNAFTNASLSTGGFSSNVTYRTIIPASAISAGGSKVRFTLGSVNFGGYSCDAMYIGEKASSGDAYDMKSSAPAPTQILVNGSGSFTIAQDADPVNTDPLTFTIDETKDYILAFHFTGTTGRGANSTVSGGQIYTKSGNDASTANATGYGTLGSNCVGFITKMDVAA